MATKRCNNLLSNSDKNDFISDSDAQFTNLNLNQNYGSSGVQLFCSNNESSHFSKNEKNDSNTFNEPSKKSCYSFEKKDSHLIPTEYLKNSWKEKKKRKEKNDLNKSTLSLHISAYENITVTDNLVDQDKSSLNKVSSGKLSSEKFKSQFVGGLTNSIFEIPRQQKIDESTEPEIMQFKASRKLIDPNQENRLESENENDVGKSEFEKLKEKANKLFQEEKYNESNKIYSEILQLPDLTPENQAVIYSNRSASYLMLGSKTSLGMAKTDAEKAIKCWPSWWKGYFRLARVYIFQEEWKKAEEMLDKALTLNSELKEIRDELSFVRCKIGEMNRGEKNNPAFAPLAPEEEAKKLCNEFGVSEKEYYDIENDAKKIPFFDNILKGHQYRDGIVVPQDYKKAAECYEEAAKLGNPEGMYNLGKLYHEGNGVKRDYSESMKWFLKAANSKALIMKGSGIGEAQHSIGLNYTEGVGVELDYRKAVEWYEKAIANGYGPSANNLGNLYKFGLGVEKSDVKAFNYFKFAAESGDTTAMINLADCYFSAEGTESLIPTREYINEGKKWLKIAAEQGDIRASAELLKLENMNFTFDSGLNEEVFKRFREFSFANDTSLDKGREDFGLERIQSDPKRKTLLLQHRELFIRYAEHFGLPNYPRTIRKPPCTPNPPNWLSSPRKITLKDMDPTKDKVYNGCVLEVRIIDWPILVCSIQTKIEDKNGDVNRLAIYNWPETGNRDVDVLQAMKIFRPNVKISIINPYHRKSNDGQNTIRVEGPEFIKIDTSLIDKLCHVCGKEAKSLPSCSGCKMALYCSKECQKLDWIQFNHKGICKHLKKYSALM